MAAPAYLWSTPRPEQPEVKGWARRYDVLLAHRLSRHGLRPVIRSARPEGPVWAGPVVPIEWIDSLNSLQGQGLAENNESGRGSSDVAVRRTGNLLYLLKPLNWPRWVHVSTTSAPPSVPVRRMPVVRDTLLQGLQLTEVSLPWQPMGMSLKASSSFLFKVFEAAPVLNACVIAA